MLTSWRQLSRLLGFRLSHNIYYTALLAYIFPTDANTEGNILSALQVAQLAAYVSEHSAYHHGETSLATTIVNLAQDFVGSNNINLLQPSGQFGTRLQV